MLRSYRAAITWSEGADPETQEAAREHYEKFLDCYYTRAIWLRKDTRDLIDKYAHEAHDFYVRLLNEMGNAGYLADGTHAKDLRIQKVKPALDNAEEKLREELEINPSWWPRIIVRKDKQSPPHQSSKDSA
jgi:hypothetical protein